jgi:hypothetical protein
MHNPVLAIAIAVVLATPCTVFAQSPSLNFQKIEQEYKPQKADGTTARDPQSGLPTGQRMHKPYVLGRASPTSTTQNKPINPALQGNVLQKSGGNSSSLYQKLNTGVHYNSATINVR